MDFVRRWSGKAEINAGRFVDRLDITASKFYDWRERYGKANEHNGWVPRDFWLEDWEKQAIIGIGTSMFPTLTSAGRSITCAAFWTAVAATSLTGICGSR